MDDLVARLRNVRVYGASLEGVVVPMGVNPVAIEAADEITRLTKHIAIMHDVADQRDQIIMERQAEIDRLRAALAEAEAERDRLRKALKIVSGLCGSDQSEKMADIPHVVRAALTRPAVPPEGEHD